MSPSSASKTVEFEGKTHQFPADATEDEIRQALQSGAHNHPLTSEGFHSPLPGYLGKADEWANDRVEGTARGLSKMFSGGLDNAIGGASDAARSAAPVALGPLALQNPLAALRTIPGGVLGAGAGSVLGEATGAPEGIRHGMEDLGGLAGGRWSNSRLTPITTALTSAAGIRPPLGPMPKNFMSQGVEPGGPAFHPPDSTPPEPPEWFAKGGVEPGGPAYQEPNMEPIAKRSPVWQGKITVPPQKAYASVDPISTGLPSGRMPGNMRPLPDLEPETPLMQQLRDSLQSAKPVMPQQTDAMDPSSDFKIKVRRR